jgi:predicted DNA-binding protein (MmcQ/YjbR family)
MAAKGAQSQIIQAVSQWENVSQQPHRFGGVEFLLGTREIGHIHGDSLVDIPFPKKVRDELVAASKAKPHHVLPDSGWISHYLHTQADIDHAIDLLRQSYEIARHQASARRTNDQPDARETAQ